MFHAAHSIRATPTCNNAAVIRILKMSAARQLRDTCRGSVSVRAAIDAQNELHALHVLQSSSHVGPLPPRLPPGRRGIVICAGGAKYIACAFVSMAALRASGCGLPIELWHVGEEELSERAAADLQSRFRPLRCVDAARALPEEDLDAAREQHYAIKPLAVVHSAFDEVLLLDADNHVLRDPTDLFDTQQGYVRCGAMFWPDFHPFPQNCAACVSLIDRLPDAPGPGHSGGAAAAGGVGEKDVLAKSGKLCPLWQQESGQLLVDRRRCRAAVQALHELTLGWRALYPTLPGAGGDKDTFQLAWYVARQPFAWGQRISAVGRMATARGRNGRHAIFFAGNTMLHRDEQGELLFAHKNLYKWAPGMRPEVEADRAWKLVIYAAPDHMGFNLPPCISRSRVPVPAELQELESQCFAYLRELEDLPWFENLCMRCKEERYSGWARERAMRRMLRTAGQHVRAARRCSTHREQTVAAVACLVVGLLLAVATSVWIAVVRARGGGRTAAA